MMTNTYLPHVGGVANSVDAFTQEYRRRGHHVLVVAPEFDGAADDEPDVVRLPAIQNFNGSDFSVRLPAPGYLSRALHDFQPQVVHSHHPFLLGDTALRVAANRALPLVFTHHTMYEQYTHYVPGESRAMRRYVIDLSAGYANLCDQVFAPSESVADVLRERDVAAPIEVVPTGVDARRFASGDGARFRREHEIPADAYVVGHVGRLAPEKNLPVLARAVAAMLRRHDDAHFLLVGEGPSREEIERVFAEDDLSDRLHLVGRKTDQPLVDAYHAMDLFAFASYSETQGMVLTEAMAADVPVVAFDAPGVREVIRDGQNGRLVTDEGIAALTEALDWAHQRSGTKRDEMRRAARETADAFSMPRCADKSLGIYERLLADGPPKSAARASEETPWHAASRLFEMEWNLWTNRARAAGHALDSGETWSQKLRRWFGGKGKG